MVWSGEVCQCQKRCPLAEQPLQRRDLCRKKEGLMASIQISKEEMLKRVARFKELKPIDYKAMGMSYVPEGMDAFSIIGQVTKDIPSIPAPHGFTMAVTKVAPGKGAPLHSHKTVEVFVPLSGQWAFYWGDKGDNAHPPGREGDDDCRPRAHSYSYPAQLRQLRCRRQPLRVQLQYP